MPIIDPGTCVCGEDIEQHTGKYNVCPDGIYEFTSRRVCDWCGEIIRSIDEPAEVVAIGQEGVPIEEHLIVHADPCYLAHTDIYSLA